VAIIICCIGSISDPNTICGHPKENQRDDMTFDFYLKLSLFFTDDLTPEFRMYTDAPARARMVGKRAFAQK
jgi:hypothetical protein